MEVRTLTTLIFGNVVVESQLLGSQLRIYGEDNRSYFVRPSSEITTAVPIDEIRGTVAQDRAHIIAEALLKPASHELEQNYNGGYESASNELAQWILGDS